MTIGHFDEAKHNINFAKKDVVVALGCVVFLLASLGAVGDSGRKRAKEAVCLSNLRQWGTIWAMYTDDNNGYFPRRTFWHIFITIIDQLNSGQRYGNSR